MALFMKQDFSPSILSRRWIAIKFRPNMLLYSREHIVSILESGLLFREDSVEVEQDAPAPEQVWRAAGGARGGLTRGEGAAAAAALAVCVLAFPPRSLSRSALVNVAAYASVPLLVRAWHRARCGGSLAPLLAAMRDYLALARRSAACLKEYAALHAHIGSLSSVIESTHTLLCRQQSEMSILLSRASSALLGNAPWLRADVAWDAVRRDTSDNLMKIHHAFLVVQSTLLKHVAMAHYVPPAHAQRIYKNHNERVHWLHTDIIPVLVEEYKQNYDALERMYRLLKNSANSTDNVKKMGLAFNDSWIYSDVHTGVAKSCLELKLVLNKCNSLDIFLDSCALNKQEIDLNVLNRDIDDVIDSLTKCLTTVQNSQLRLRKIQNKNDKQTDVIEKEDVVENTGVLKIEDKVPESKDEVFYFMKTDDDDNTIQPADDLTTAPGKRERETTKIVLNELRRKLGKREDIMRERERQALAKTMPELKDIPDFPRQINFDEFSEKKGYIKKLQRPEKPEKRSYRINFKKNIRKDNIYTLNFARYSNERDIKGDIYEANAKLNLKSKLLTIRTDNSYILTKWCKYVQIDKNELDSSGLSEGLSDVEASTANKTVHESVNNEIRFTKKDLELSPSSSESDLDIYTEKRLALLNDVRRHRPVRKKTYPIHRRATDNVDESMKPINYSFGTGMAMASVLQVSRKFPNMSHEEVFIGDGEVSTDSGNDEDA